MVHENGALQELEGRQVAGGGRSKRSTPDRGMKPVWRLRDPRSVPHQSEGNGFYSFKMWKASVNVRLTMSPLRNLPRSAWTEGSFTLSELGPAGPT